MFVIFDFPDYIFRGFFNRVTNQDNISRSFDASLTMPIEESYTWIFNALNTIDAYNFFFLWQGTYIDKNLYFSVGSTSLDAAAK